jgi:PAS domain S-box-containing protein
MQDEFRTLVEAMPDAILVQSRDRIVFVNPACMRLLGAERSEQLVGKDVSEIIHPNSLPTIRVEFKSVTRIGRRFRHWRTFLSR